jgi:hypothetical protein
MIIVFLNQSSSAGMPRVALEKYVSEDVAKIDGKSYHAVESWYLCKGCAFRALSPKCPEGTGELKLCATWERQDGRNIIWVADG